MMRDLTPEQLDLLLAVTDGSLEGEALDAARARIAADPLLAEELRLQEAATAYLSEERVAPMADFEAARMRRGVLDEVLPQQAAKAPWFSRLVPVAAVLALVVAGVGFVGGLGSDDASVVEDQIAAVAPAESDTSEREELPQAEFAPKDDAADLEEAPAEEALEDGIAAAEVPPLDIPDLGPLGDGPLDEAQLDLLVSSLGGAPTPVFVVLPSCDGVTHDGDLVLDVVGAATGLVGDAEVRVLLTSGEAVLVVDPDSCTVEGTR